MNLHWELSVLSRAVAYNNLSGAASHVGLSQPQLSRIIARIESELGVLVLDRSVKRKSSFTSIAHKLAEAYAKSTRSLNGELHRIIEGTEPRQLTVGTLEGLLSAASGFCREALDGSQVTQLELDVYDLDELEEQFYLGNLDFIFTSREPGRRKHRLSKVIGFQSLKKLERTGSYQIMSPFEHHSSGTKKRSPSKVLISNSLAVRKHWLETFGGSGWIPSPLRKGAASRSADEIPLYLIAGDHLSPAFWERAKTWI
jgi:hypothetical protein